MGQLILSIAVMYIVVAGGWWLVNKTASKRELETTAGKEHV